MSEDAKSGLIFLLLICTVMAISIVLGHAFGETSVLEKLAKDKKVCDRHIMSDGTKIEKCFVVVEQYIVGK